MSDTGELRERLSDLAPRFSADPDPVRKKLTELLLADPPNFRAAALQILPGLGDQGMRQCLLDLMLKRGLLPVCDPALIGLEQEVAITRDLFALDPLLDMKLARRLSGTPGERVPEEVVQRVLVLLNSIPENGRVMPIVIKLLRHESPNVRSKAALVIGRLSKTPQVMEEFQSQADPRVRANAIEALWGMDSARARGVLRDAAGDPNNRVVGNALLGLYRLGETAAIPKILQLAEHPRPEFRTTAAWVMEQSGSPRFLPALGRMVREDNPNARARVFRAITALKRISDGAAALPRLRVHLSRGLVASGGPREICAAIASVEGREMAQLPGTSLLVWEDSRPVAEYSVTPFKRPESLGLALVLPEGDSAAGVLEALTPLKRPQDRWQECRYMGVSEPALGQAFAFLQTMPENRHMIFVVPPSGDQAQWEPVLARASQSSVKVEIVQHDPADAGQVATACEKAYLMALCGYRIRIHSPDGAPEPAEMRLEVYTGGAYGAGVLKPGG